MLCTYVQSIRVRVGLMTNGCINKNILIFAFIGAICIASDADFIENLVDLGNNYNILCHSNINAILHHCENLVSQSSKHLEVKIHYCYRTIILLTLYYKLLLIESLIRFLSYLILRMPW